MTSLGLERDVVDRDTYGRAVESLRASGVRLPTFAQLTDPAQLTDDVRASLAKVGPDDPHPLNLFRVHWFNDAARTGIADAPGHLVLGEELTGVEAPIIVVCGDRFPMITAHKVLAAYACLAARLVTGQFDPSRQRAVWPSTGNYCRGGVAISRALGVHGVAVLPEGMSAERFEWLSRWVLDPTDVVRTPGTESNVKEIYDECARLGADPQNVILNQFAEFANHLAHVTVTGPAMERAFGAVATDRPGLELAAFVSATGSAGTLGAGDYLHERHGSRTVAVEALECPTLLLNGFGEHNIQGIGDKHVPYIHNVMGTHAVVAVSDRATDQLNLVFNTDTGRAWMASRGFAPELIDSLSHLGLSSICNVLASIRLAKTLGLGPKRAVVTVATDGAALYTSELDKTRAKYFPEHSASFEADDCERIFDDHLRCEPEHVRLCDDSDRTRMFNLGYFTWVEQQGVSIEDFEARRSLQFWRDLRDLIPAWDERIEAFNRETGAAR